MERAGDQENAPNNRTGRGWLMGARDTERGERKKPHSETTLPQTSGSLSIGKTTILGICRSEKRVRIGYCNEKTRRTTTNRSLRLMLVLRVYAEVCWNLSTSSFETMEKAH